MLPDMLLLARVISMLGLGPSCLTYPVVGMDRIELELVTAFDCFSLAQSDWSRVGEEQRDVGNEKDLSWIPDTTEGKHYRSYRCQFYPKAVMGSLLIADRLRERVVVEGKAAHRYTPFPERIGSPQ
jgi:hypothetical protein